MEPEKIGESIEKIAHLSFDLKEGLKKKYGWNESDARITVFNKIINVINTANLGYVFISKYLQKKDWWKENELFSINEGTIIKTVEEFEMSIRIALIQNVMYATESSFRIFSRAVQPGACKNGAAEFKSIYSSLLKKTSLQEKEILLDLFRNIRNTMHNNGLFFPPNNKNQEIIFQGKEFHFIVGEHCHFVETELVVKLTANIIVLLQEFIETPIVSIIEVINEES